MEEDIRKIIEGYINGIYVCGLHVPNNLQVITELENLKKSNKYNRGKIYDNLDR